MRTPGRLCGSGAVTQINKTADGNPFNGSNGCGNDNGAFEYVDGSDTYHRYTDPRFTSSGYGTSYSTVMSGTNVNKAVSDSRYRFYYILNYNGKLGALNPMQEATDGVMFCVRNAN